jgi:hypothetical protein
MRTKLVTAFLLAALAPSMAWADAADSLVGRYEVSFEQVTSNCESGGLTLGKSALVVARKAPGITVEVARVATLSGKAAKAGRLKAASALGKTTGGEGKFSIAGTIDEAGKLDAVFVAEFYADGKPRCTQSWSVTGTRAAEARPQASDEPVGSTVAPAAFTRFGLPPVD